MKKFTLKHVFEGLRSTVQQPQAKPEQVSIVETLQAENFQVAKTVRHGFPYQPTSLAFDPIQKVLAVGTKHGSIRLIGRPGVDVHVRHESEAAVLHMLFLINEGALVAATADDAIHLWNYRQKRPEIVHSLKFQRERITCLFLPFQSKWLYVGTERGNIHIVNIEVFQLSGYTINWNKAVELSRKTHPGAVVHLSDCPVDPSKLLIGYDSGSLVVWDLKNKAADARYQCAEPLKSISWHHEGKQFMCSHSDGSLTTWAIKQTTSKPVSAIFPHAKTNKEGKQEPCKCIQKVEWKCSKNGDTFVIFSGGLTNDRAGRTPSITVIHGKTTTVLEMEHNVVDFITLCESPFASDFAEPYALVVLLHNDLVVVDLHTQGYPCFENPYSMDLHESPVTCCTYLADCPADLIPAFYSVGARGQKRQGFSEREWPISGGEWGSSCSYAEMIITGHADGTVKFWDASSVSLQVLYKLKTAKVFEKPRTRSIDGDEDPFAIQHIFLCPESRLLCIAGATAHVVLFKYFKQETTGEVPCLEIPIVYEVYESGDCSPEYEFPPRPTLQVAHSPHHTAAGEASDKKPSDKKGHSQSQNHRKKKGASLDYFVPIRVRGGSQKKAAGYQADLVCLTPWVDGEPPGSISALSINSSYGLLSYGNESGLVIVDYIAKSCLLNMGTPELYGNADPYQRVPRSPKRADSSKEDERCKSPSSDQDVKDIGASVFYLRHDQSDFNGVNKRECKDDLRDSKKLVSRSDSKGKGDLEIRKYLMRKDSRGVDKGKEDKKNNESKTGSDLKKLLTRKESKSKDKEDKDIRKDSEKEDKSDELPVYKKQQSLSEGRSLGVEETDSKTTNEGKLETAVSLEPGTEMARERTVAHENIQKELRENKSSVVEAKRQTRFRLKAQFNKLDARFRKAFSSENNSSMENNTEFYVDDEIVVVDDDGEMKNKAVSEIIEDKSSSSEQVEVGEEVTENGEYMPDESKGKEYLEVHSNSMTGTSPKGSPRSSPKPSPKTTPKPSPIDEAIILEQVVGEESKVKEMSDARSALTLFDEDGNPVPPPRRKVRLAESKQKVIQNTVESMDLDREMSLVSIQDEPQGTESATIPASTPVDKEESTSVSQRHSYRSQGSEGTPHTPGQVASTGVTVTSPNSKGAFKSFVSHITKKSSSQALQDKLDGSFSRSRSSSISSLENISSEAIQCLAFADSYTRKNDSQMAPTLWVGTSLGSVIQVMVSIPPLETRLSTPATVIPSGTIFRLKGSVLAMSFLDCNGALIPYQYESWRDANKEKKLERTPTKSLVDNRMSPTNSGEQTWGDRQFVVIGSEKVARVVALPSQNCVYKQIITEVSFVVKAEIIQIKDSVCLVCYVATGHISVFSLPSLRQLIYVDFLPLVDLRIARTFCFTNYGHGMYLCSPTEIQKFTLASDFCKELQNLLGELFQPHDMPEPPKQSFFKGLFGGGVSQLDREELFGESSGKGSRSVAKHVPGPTAQLEALNAKAGSVAGDVARTRMLMVERGQKLSELEERTGRMMNESESFSTAAHQLMLKYKDKKWYQL
ncbi:syntaxin-binding protein 5 isoform X2 [Macrobrachium rosenbergii]|uniref:syntaxin-binding protein 5 isoform X2 n=1 Tax=Macrobrachium rosenbergii TaxID=79674 RepID=UPI0034D3DD65